MEKRAIHNKQSPRPQAAPLLLPKECPSIYLCMKFMKRQWKRYNHIKRQTSNFLTRRWVVGWGLGVGDWKRTKNIKKIEYI